MTHAQLSEETYAALSYWCARPYATSAWGLKLLVQAGWRDDACARVGVNATHPAGMRRRMLTYTDVCRSTQVGEMTHAQVSAQTARILRECGGWPNTYCLTKCIGEQLLSERLHRHPLPCVILRPSIVTCAIQTPMPVC
jgi:hypothetical protein